MKRGQVNLAKNIEVLSRARFTIIVAFITIFLFINASAVYGASAEVFRGAILTYLIFQAVIVAVPDVYLRPEERTLAGGMINFFLGFLVTGVILTLLVSISKLIEFLLTVAPVGGVTDIGLVASFGFFHGFVVAYTEELAFRGVLMSAFGSQGLIISSILFGIFHWVAYSGSLVAVIFAIVLGLVFGVLARRFGVLFAAGAHTAYNMLAMGLLTSLFLGGLA